MDQAKRLASSIFFPSRGPNGSKLKAAKLRFMKIAKRMALVAKFPITSSLDNNTRKRMVKILVGRALREALEK